MKSIGFPIFLIIVVVVAGLFSGSCRKGDYATDVGPELIRDFGEGTGTVTWTADRSYLLEGFVFVNDGQVLTIEAGTVIRAKPGQGSSASALIVARGGTLIAPGTSEKPIIFTVEGDDLEGSVPVEAKGLWGGVIMLGRAPLNVAAGEVHIEGIPVYEPRGIYGGFDHDDNSGILEYVSIRHCGTNIGEGNEINGLTLGGVGSKTTINHIEVISCADDGVEIFGGTVDIKYLIVAMCEDDIVDIDLGYQGRGQFWFGFQESSSGDRLLEIGGGMDPVLGQPFTLPVVYNATMIGRDQPDGPQSLLFNRNAGGWIANSLFMNQGSGLFIEYLEGSQNSFDMLTEGNLQLLSNIFYNIAGSDIESVCNILASPGIEIATQKGFLENYFTQHFNDFSNPGIEINEDGINPLPTGDVYQNITAVPDDWFDQTTFKGAFYTYNWASGWSLSSREGIIR